MKKPKIFKLYKYNCKHCHVEFLQRRAGKQTKVYCTQSCGLRGQWADGLRVSGRIGKTPWNKGMEMPRLEKSHSWKGDDAGYDARHKRAYSIWGAPNKCEGCGTEIARKFEWANISNEYKNDRIDWLRLCTSCHRYMDYAKLFK